jgi:hypothetical protein
VIFWVGQALAGSGPWVVGEGGITVYVGTEAQRLENLAVQVEGERDVVPVGEGLSSFGIKGIGTVGLGSRIDLQLSVPWYRVQTSRPDHPLCAALGLGACRTTQGVGIIETRLKGMALNEFFGAPFSLAVGAELRNGDFTTPTRERITNLGEGSFDLGPFVDVGRTGALGEGYWSAWIEGQFRYRLPTTRTYPGLEGEGIAPGSEFAASTEWIFGPKTYVAFGPSASAIWRPFGLDWGELDLSDPDRFGALKVAQARVGATAIVRASKVTGALSVQRTIFAYNNPTDTLFVSLGLQFDGRLPGVGDG